MKLSNRARELLVIIDKATDIAYDSDTPRSRVILRYYTPHVSDYVSGAGDARCLRSLETKGLIERMSISSYSYAITEEGRLIAQTIG